MKKRYLIIFSLLIIVILSTIACEKKKNFDVYYDLNGGTLINGQIHQKIAYLEDAIEPQVSKEGYTFLGFDKESKKISKSITITAQYSPNTYQISLETDGEITSLNVTFGQSMPIASKPVLNNLTFGGFYTQEYGGGEMYYDSQMQSIKNWDIAKDTTLYAKCYNVITLDNQDDEIETVEVFRNKPMPILPIPQKQGLVFMGYYIQPNGNGEKYYNENMESLKDWENESDLTLYGYFESKILEYQYIDGINAFGVSNYYGTQSTVNIPSFHKGERVVSILKDAFKGNYTITKVNIPATVKYIEDYAFYNCVKLENIELPDNLEKIGKHSFENCFSLKSITIPSKVEEVGDFSFNYCSNLFDITIKLGVKRINSFAFSNNASLTGITLPSSIIDIQEGAFLNNINLVDITLSSNLTTIGREAFCGCNNLFSINFPNTLVFIGKKAFYDTSIYNLELPENLQFIDDQAFNTLWLHNVFLNSAPFAIGSSSFGEGCFFFTPENVEEFKIYLGWKNYSNLYDKSSIAQGGFLIDEDVLLTYTGDSETIIIPKKVKEIEKQAFKGVKGKITFEDNAEIQTIEEFCFDYYLGEEIIIPEGVTSINGNAFNLTDDLKKITLPSTLITTGTNIFKESKKLTEVYMLSELPPFAEGEGNFKKIKLYISEINKIKYLEHPYWQRFNVISIN